VTSSWRRVSWARWRDAILFFTGIGLLINELVTRTGPERPTVLLLLAGLVGAPAFLRADEKQSTPDDPAPKGETPSD